jgi:hypothetical protein
MALKSLKRHEGWLLLDHRASPGIPAEIARQIGLDPKLVAGGKKAEAATLSCSHCGGAWVKNPKRVRARDYCKKCDHYICGGCAYLTTLPGYVHQRKEQRLDAALSKSLIIV